MKSGNGDLGNGLEEGSDSQAYADFVKQKVSSTFTDFYADRSDNLVTIATALGDEQQNLRFFEYGKMKSLVPTDGSTTITLSSGDSQLLLQELQSNALFSSGQLNSALNELADEAGFNVYLDKSKDIFTGFKLSNTSGQVEISSQVITDPTSAASTTLITFTVGVTPQYIFNGRSEVAPSTDFTFSFFENSNSKFGTFFQNWVSGIIGSNMYGKGITQFDEDKLNMGGDATHEATHEQNEAGAFDSLSTANPDNDATKHWKLREAFLDYTTVVDQTPTDNLNALFETQLSDEVKNSQYSGTFNFNYAEAGVESSTNSFGSVGISDAQVIYVSDNESSASGDDAANLFFRDTPSGANASSTLPGEFIKYLDEQAFSATHGQSATEAFTSQYTTDFASGLNAKKAIQYGKVSIKGIKLNLTDDSGNPINTIEMPPLNLSYDYTPTVATSNQAELGTLPTGLNGDADEQLRLTGYYYLLTKYFQKWRQATGIFASDSTNGVIQFHRTLTNSWNTQWGTNSANATYFGRYLNPLHDPDQNIVTDPATLGLSPAPYGDSTLTAMGYMANNYFLKEERAKADAKRTGTGARQSLVNEYAANNYPSMLIKANIMVSQAEMYWETGSDWRWYNNKTAGNPGSWVFLSADSPTTAPFQLRMSTDYFYFKVTPSAAQLQKIYDGTLPYLAQVS